METSVDVGVTIKASLTDAEEEEYITNHVTALEATGIVFKTSTSLPLTALPLRRLITSCRFRVTVLSTAQQHAALNGYISIALKLIRNSTVATCRCGKISGGVIEVIRVIGGVGKTLPLCLPLRQVQWHLRSCTNIAIKVPMRASGKVV